MIAGGQTLDEISENLFLSKNTVSNHRNSVMKKLDLRNNSEITIYAIKNDLVS
jgi:DNA-binding NarL/FixJ family response regulator